MIKIGDTVKILKPEPHKQDSFHGWAHGMTGEVKGFKPNRFNPEFPPVEVKVNIPDTPYGALCREICIGTNLHSDIFIFPFVMINEIEDSK
jgi:hypothetical protein